MVVRALGGVARGTSFVMVVVMMVVWWRIRPPSWVGLWPAAAVRRTRGLGSGDGPRRRPGRRTILGVQVAPGVISSTPTRQIRFPVGVLVAQVSAGSSVVDGVNVVNPVLFLITLYVAQGAGMGIHLWNRS